MCYTRKFSMEAKWELFPVDVAFSSTAATSLANKSFEELFLDRVKPNPTKKDKRKSKLLLIKCNVGIKNNTSC